jgi:hypothetical protein
MQTANNSQSKTRSKSIQPAVRTSARISARKNVPVEIPAKEPEPSKPIRKKKPAESVKPTNQEILILLRDQVLKQSVDSLTIALPPELPLLLETDVETSIPKTPTTPLDEQVTIENKEMPSPSKDVENPNKTKRRRTAVETPAETKEDTNHVYNSIPERGSILNVYKPVRMFMDLGGPYDYLVHIAPTIQF